jgi:hypothetical protein
MLRLSEGNTLKYDMLEIKQNLRDAWSETTAKQRLRGENWYPAAHDFAHVIGRGNVRLGAGLLAATSPNKGWNDNRRIAVNASFGIFGGQVTNSLDKARRIMNGEDPKDVLPMGKKTGHFFMNILDPFDPGWVTLDRHAIRVATSEWDNGSPLLTPAQYAPFAAAFGEVAQEFDVLPSAFQAGLWIYARERVGRG